MLELFLDTETGGLDPYDHSLLSVAAIKVDSDFREIARFETYIRSDVFVVTPKAMEINRINLASSCAWPTHQEAKGLFLDFLGVTREVLEKPVKVDRWRINGKNPAFDMGMLRAFFGFDVFDRVFMYAARDIQETYENLVELGVYRPLGRHKLHDLCTALGIQHDEGALHNAMYDTEMTLRCAQKMHAVKRRLRSYIAKIPRNQPRPTAV